MNIKTRKKAPGVPFEMRIQIRRKSTKKRFIQLHSALSLDEPLFYLTIDQLILTYAAEGNRSRKDNLPLFTRFRAISYRNFHVLGVPLFFNYVHY